METNIVKKLIRNGRKDGKAENTHREEKIVDIKPDLDQLHQRSDIEHFANK